MKFKKWVFFLFSFSFFFLDNKKFILHGSMNTLEMAFPFLLKYWSKTIQIQ